VRAYDIQSLGVPWIEDCATSPATSVGGRPAGASGTLAVFSFASTKYVTGGSGGVLACDDDVTVDGRIDPRLWGGAGGVSWAARPKPSEMKPPVTRRSERANHRRTMTRPVSRCVSRRCRRIGSPWSRSPRLDPALLQVRAAGESGRRHIGTHGFATTGPYPSRSEFPGA